MTKTSTWTGVVSSVTMIELMNFVQLWTQGLYHGESIQVNKYKCRDGEEERETEWECKERDREKARRRTEERQARNCGLGVSKSIDQAGATEAVRTASRQERAQARSRKIRQ